MTTLHSVIYNRSPFEGPRPLPNASWWRRKGLWVNPDNASEWTVRTDRNWNDDPWMVSLEFYDRRDDHLPVEAFKVIGHREILGDYRKDRLIIRNPNSWLDILAPHPPSTVHWEPLTWPGEHGWPGLGRPGYALNSGGYHSDIELQTSR